MSTARHNQPRAALGRPSQAVSGIVPGSTDHRILLALRGTGGMTSDQVRNRFNGHQSGALHRLKVAGLVELPAMGHKGRLISLTEQGNALVSPDGPLSRRKTLIAYCQL